MPEIEEQIQRALREGKFKNLPGKGKPLRLDDNPHQDPEWRLALHMLHSSGYSLPWIELRQEIEQDIYAARANLQLKWSYFQPKLEANPVEAHVSEEWNKVLMTFRNEVKAINKRIREYNLIVPSMKIQRSFLDVEKEIKRITTDKN